MIAGPQGILLVRDGAALGLLLDEAADEATPDGLGGFVYEHPARIDQDEDAYLVWIRADGAAESTEGLISVGWGAGDLQLQEVDWIPRLGRSEWGSWIPQMPGALVYLVGVESRPLPVLISTLNPLQPSEHYPAGGIPVSPEWGVSAQAWTGRHHVLAYSAGTMCSALAFARVDGTIDMLPNNPVPAHADCAIAHVDAEPGSPLVAYTVNSNASSDFGSPTTLHVVDLNDGTEVFSAQIGDEHEVVTRLDLHDGQVAVSTAHESDYGLGAVRLVDLRTGDISTIPWSGTASFFHLARPLPASPYPVAAPPVPELVVTTPLEGSTVASAQVRFEGYATPGARVTAAGRFPVEVGADGLWSTTLTLNPGSNLAEFAAALPGGGATETALAVFLEVTQPAVTVQLFPRSGRPRGALVVVRAADGTTGEPIADAAVTVQFVYETAAGLKPAGEAVLITDERGWALHLHEMGYRANVVQARVSQIGYAGFVLPLCTSQPAGPASCAEERWWARLDLLGR